MTIFSDFIAIQKELPPLVKDTQGDGYKYPTLNQLLDIVLPMCHDRGLGLMQVTHPVEGGVGVETVLFNDKNEHISSGILAMPLTTDADGNIINVGGKKRQGGVYGQFGAQAYGSALTYARRYSLTAFFGMKAEDDDGYQASQRHQKQPQKSEDELKLESEKTDVYNAMKDVMSIEELKDVTLEIMEGKDDEKRKIFWNVALQTVRGKKWNEDEFRNLCKKDKEGR